MIAFETREDAEGLTRPSPNGSPAQQRLRARDGMCCLSLAGRTGAEAEADALRRGGVVKEAKYTPANLLALFRLATKFRNDCLKQGYTDNMGAIHSAERAIHLLTIRLRYPGLSHIRLYCDYQKAEFSVKALEGFERGEKPRIEHVQPHRAFVAKLMNSTLLGDEELFAIIKKDFRLVLVTRDEAKHLDGLNRTKIERGRLRKAGITLATQKQVEEVRARLKAKAVAAD